MNIELIKKRLMYRSSHRGTKELELLLGDFIRTHINELSLWDCQDLEELLEYDEYMLEQMVKGKVAPPTAHAVAQKIIDFARRPQSN